MSPLSVQKLRRAGVIRCGWISDTTRMGYYVNTYRNAGDFLRANAGLYRAGLWDDLDTYCEVWVESRSIAGIPR